MINVSTQLKKESLTNRNYYVTANVTLSNGATLKLGKKDFYLSGNSLVDSADSGDFPVGVAIEKTASLSLVNDDGHFDGYNFNAARFVIFLNVQLSDRIETIKRGTYIVSKKPATASEIILSLLDKMHNADKAYDSNLSFPCTVKELLSECCQQCNIALGDTTFPNSNFQIQQPPSSTTYRTVIGMCAGIAGGNARIDENDLLRIITFDKTFTNTTIYDGGAVKNWTNGNDLDGGTLNPWTTGTVVDGGTLSNNDYHALFSIQNLQYDVDDVIVTGIKYVEDETEYMSGQDGYVITIDNQLLSGNAQAGVEAIGNQLIGLRMRPFSCDGIANGYATFGDPVEFIDTKNRVFRSFVTDIEFVFGGSTSWSCSAKSAEEDVSEFIGGQQAAVEQSKKDIEKKLSAYDVKLKQMNELAANTLGFFYTEKVQEDGSVITYRHDKPTLADSKVIYKTGVDGFFLSVDGGQTWKAGFDSNGDAVLNILYAIGIQSEWINTRGFTAKDNNGNTTLKIDAYTGAVTLEVENFTLKSRTIEQIAKDVVDGTVQSNVTIPNYYGTYVPTLQNYPASEWKSEEYKKHDGSIFMNFSTSQVYMFSITDGVSVKLDKRIPVAAGMAGGSTDAAAMLIGVNRLFSLGLTKRQLMERSVQIGADVPYCIMRGTALAEGIGEALSPLPPMVKCPVLIAKPSISVSTKFVYQNLKLDDTTIHPDIDRLIDDIKAKNLHDIAAHMGNVLETVTIPNYPVIDEIKKHMLSNGAVGAMMSGSGPTVFGLFDDEDTAKKAYKAMRSSHLARQVYLTSVYNNRK